MFDLARLARHPALAGYFSLVHPFFWPVLLWYLRKVAAQVDAAGRDNALIRITWWGGVYLEYLGDRADAWKKPEPTKPAWSDPVWETHLPPNMAAFLVDNLQADETCPQGAVILLRLRGRCPKGAEGALRLNTS